ncbi:MAG: FAD:protein FMN transferase [Phycisphaerae bacterium]|nr:FAD:protein FMN transferase [Phycisphaerae bacterium]
MVRDAIWLGVLLAALGAAVFWKLPEPVASLVTVSAEPRGIMGTTCSLRVVVRGDQTERGQEVLKAAEAALRRVEGLMSSYRADSEVGRFNTAPAMEWVALSPETTWVLRLARSFVDQTDGAFDVTARPIIELWKRCGREGRLPSEDEIEKARAASNWDAIRFAGYAVHKSAATTSVDLGGIAKGYAIDQAILVMQRAGCRGGLVDVGGDVRCFGLKPDASQWRIGVRDPFGKELWGKLLITDRAACTSGDYLRYVEIAGERYSHIVDPRSGMPAKVAASVTVLAKDATTADAWATGLSVLGPDGLTRLPRGGGLEAMMITGDAGGPKVHMTDGFASFLVREEAR